MYQGTKEMAECRIDSLKNYIPVRQWFFKIYGDDAARLIERCVSERCKKIDFTAFTHEPFNGTEKRTRTSTGLPPLAPEASVSTNSTTSAIDAYITHFRDESQMIL